jgi:peptidoglycan hydrolase CwlO-like protein
MRRTSNTGKLVALAGMAVVVVAAVACAGSTSKNRPASDTSNGPAAAPKSIDSSSGGGALGFDTQTKGEAAPNAQVAQSDGASAPSDTGALALPDVLGRKIVMVSTVSVGVKDVAQAFEDVGNIATVDGGFLASSSFGHDGDGETASVTIRVPSDKYPDALARVRKLGDVQNEKSDSNDVTQDYTDLQSRLHSLQAALQQYLSFLDRAGDIGQVLQVQDRINQTQAEIEQTQGRINLLDNQTDLATITVHLAPVVPAKPEPKGGSDNPLDVAADAFWQSIEVLKGIATGVLVVAAFSWWLLPLAGAGLYFGRKQVRADRARAAVAPPPTAPSV